MQNQSEITSNSVLEPKCAKFDQNSNFGHARTYSWLHTLRNTQGKIYGTYLGNKYRIYKEYLRNLHKHLWYRKIRNTGATFGGAPLGLCFWLFYIINIYGYSSYIPYIFHIYFLDIFHVFSFMCCLVRFLVPRIIICQEQWQQTCMYTCMCLLKKWIN